jgi:hypothetical protein
MNKKLNFLSMLVCLLALGLVLAGCDNGSTDSDPNTDPKTITLTGIPGNVSYVAIAIFTSDSVDDIKAEGRDIDNGSIALSLKTENNRGDNVDWTGYGSYYISLMAVVGNESNYYIYTNGKSLDELGISASLTDEQLISKAPKYNITNASSTIAFSQFTLMPSWLVARMM